MLILIYLYVAKTFADVWTWVGGIQGDYNGGPSFQSLLLEAPSNTPGAVEDMAYVMEGGFIYVFGGVSGTLQNKLWRLNVQTKMWSVLSTPSSDSTVFGVKGAFATNVAPSVRTNAMLFVDTELNALFCYGGAQFITQLEGNMFEFSFSMGMWRWIHGSTNLLERGNFGELGVESSSNLPRGRSSAVIFYDQATKKAYLYGGNCEALYTQCADHWVFSVKNNTWTWIHGVKGVDVVGVYGENGNGTLFTRPGSRAMAAYAYDRLERKCYLYGGYGFAETGPEGYTTDLWSYDVEKNIWTFIGGNRDTEFRENYGTKGVTETGTFPSSRFGASMTIDEQAHVIYYFGGFYESNSLNDMWTLDLSTLTWTWIAGLSSYNSAGRYGEIGVSSLLNAPPARFLAAMGFYNDSSGVYLFGGEGRRAYFADIWKFGTGELSVITSLTRSEITGSSTASHTTTARRRLSPIPLASTPSRVLEISIGVSAAFFVGVLCFASFLRYKQRQRFMLQQVDAVIEKPLEYTSSMSNSTKNTLAPSTMGLSLPGHLLVGDGDFRSDKLLASGGGGDVFSGEALSAALGKRCRYFVVKRPKILNNASLKLFEQEISVMYLLSTSQFVAKLVGFSLQPPALLMKKYADGSLLSFASKTILTQSEKIRFTLDIARGLRDIHKAEIAHCDMKPHNVLIDRGINGMPFCVITDFGIAHILSEKLLVVKYSQAVSIRGLSVHYAAPEVFIRFRKRLVSSAPHLMKAADAFAYAMVIFFVLEQIQPWDQHFKN